MGSQKRFQQFISGQNLRMTSERKTILESLVQLHDHFTVTELLHHLEASGHKISRATVYRTIPHLIRSRIIRKASVCSSNEEQVYEHIFGHTHHDHLVCDHCGKVVEFFDNEIEDLQDKIAGRYGFKLKYHFLELWGICPECQEKIIEHEIYK
ncbi:transcriptional repressor [bacterium]|nr:transcriptional repressor [bacterium]